MSIHPAPGHTSEVFISTLLYYRPWYFLGLTASKLVLGVRIVSLDDADCVLLVWVKKLLPSLQILYLTGMWEVPLMFRSLNHGGLDSSDVGPTLYYLNPTSYLS